MLSFVVDKREYSEASKSISNRSKAFPKHVDARPKAWNTSVSKTVHLLFKTRLSRTIIDIIFLRPRRFYELAFYLQQRRGLALQMQRHSKCDCQARLFLRPNRSRYSQESVTTLLPMEGREEYSRTFQETLKIQEISRIFFQQILLHTI